MTSALTNTQTVAIGIDVGGTKIAAGLVTSSGELLCRRLIPTQAERGGEVVLRDVEALALELAGEAKAQGLSLSGMGVGVAELIDLAGAVASEHTIKWRGLPVVHRLSRVAPTRLEADVRAAALAEAKCGAGQGFDSFLYLTVGTGISCCLVLHGRPFAGAHGAALICASSSLTCRCAECGAENRFVLEEYAAGPALVNRYRRCTAVNVSQAEQVFHHAAAGDQDARRVLETAGSALGVTTGLLINVLDPQAVVVGGGLGRAGGCYWESFVKSTREHTWSELVRHIPIKRAALDEAGVIGAALTVWQTSKKSFGDDELDNLER
ncbi:MAG: ROK family protein [Pyrinomonadaceae bacterium]